MKKFFLQILVLGIIFPRLLNADLVWEETKRDGTQAGIKKFWLKANLLRIDLASLDLSYYYNLENHYLIILDRNKNQFRGLDWKELNSSLSEYHSIVQKLISEQKDISQELSYQKLSWTDPFGWEPIFFCKDLFQAQPSGKTKNFGSRKAVEYLLQCANQVQAQVWVDAGEAIFDWERFKAELRWLNLERFRFYYSLPNYPILIESPKKPVSYEIKILSTTNIPLEIFLLPESAKPELNSD